MIVENPASLARALLPWAFDSAPDLDVGTVEGVEHYQFFRVTGVAQLSDGRIVVVNAGTQELRFFDGQGAFLSTVGGEGEGPGEYQFPVLITAVTYDTLWIYDRSRLSLLDAGGQLLQTITLRSLVAQPVGILEGMLVTGQGSARARPDTPESIVPNDITYELVNPSTGARDTIAEIEGLLFCSGTPVAVSASHAFRWMSRRALLQGGSACTSRLGSVPKYGHSTQQESCARSFASRNRPNPFPSQSSTAWLPKKLRKPATNRPRPNSAGSMAR